METTRQRSPRAQRRARSVPILAFIALLVVTIALSGVPVLATAGAQAAVDPGEAASGFLVPTLAGPDLAAPTIVPEQPRGARAAAATFVVNYSGFTPQAQTAFQRAVDIWAGQLTSSVPIVIDASFAPLETGVLGSAGATTYRRNFTGAPRTATWYPIPLANKLAGTDLAPGTSDIVAEFSSSSINWYYGTGATPAGQYNFTSVVLHEIGHGLGFAGSAQYSGGTGSWGLQTNPPSSPVDPVVFDRFVYTGSGSQITNVFTFPNPSTTLGTQYTSNQLFFIGSASNAANNGNKARLHAPSTWEPGSSFSHLNKETYISGNPNSLMTPSISPGESIYDPGPITRGIFADMGWTTNEPAPTPTPSPSASPSTSPSPSPTPAQRFADVPPGAFGYAEIDQLAARGITTGCDPANFCPTREVNRAEMAAFIIRAITGQSAAPAGPATPTFADVPADHPQYGFIEALVARGITTGCGDPNAAPREYCPGSPVNRAEMAAFLIRALTGQTAAPAGPATPTFADVPATHPQYGFIEALVAAGVTTGCGDPNARPREYCPGQPVLREQMAVFIIRAYPNP